LLKVFCFAQVDYCYVVKTTIITMIFPRRCLIRGKRTELIAMKPCYKCDVIGRCFNKVNKVVLKGLIVNDEYSVSVFILDGPEPFRAMGPCPIKMVGRTLGTRVRVGRS